MGGKSSYIRMAALITIMAQVGCFIPAQAAEMSVFRSIYTRMGASDNLQLGRSTFLEELTEASAIVNYADQRSLVVMVCVWGRGRMLVWCGMVGMFVCAPHKKGTYTILYHTHV